MQRCCTSSIKSPPSTPFYLQLLLPYDQVLSPHTPQPISSLTHTLSFTLFTNLSLYVPLPRDIKTL